MSLSLTDVYNARDEAERTIKRANEVTRTACRLAAGRLRISGVPDYVLKQLKRELKDYNIQTGCWK